MKKNKSLFMFVLTFVLLLPFCVNAEENVNIIGVEPLSTGEVSERFDKPTFNGLEIGLKGWFHELGDNIQYKVLIENKDNADYKLADYTDIKEGEAKFPAIDYSKSEYISYSLFCEDGYILNANSTKECHLSITYRKEIPNSLQSEDGNFKELNTFSINLVDENDTKDNPGTNSNIMVIIVIMLVSASCVIFILKSKKKYSFITMLLVLNVIPIYAFAASTINVTINSEISIVSNLGSYASDPSFCYINELGEYSVHTYRENMTWSEYVNSDYNTSNFYVMPENPIVPLNPLVGDEKIIKSLVPPKDYSQGQQDVGSFYYHIDTENDLIKPCNEVCYTSN